MIIPQASRAGFTIFDIRIVADAPWNDSFSVTEFTRPLPHDWVSLELIIRPSYDHVSLIRKLTSVGVGAEIIIDDADRAEFSFRVAQSVVETFQRGQFVQMFRAVYSNDDFDSVELWRGAFIVDPGLLP